MSEHVTKVVWYSKSHGDGVAESKASRIPCIRRIAHTDLKHSNTGISGFSSAGASLSLSLSLSLEGLSRAACGSHTKSRTNDRSEW